MGKIGPGGRGLLSASTPGKGQRPLPSGVPPSRPLRPHCSYTPPTPAYLLARLSPDLLWAGLVGGPSFAKQLQGRGKEPLHTHTHKCSECGGKRRHKLVNLTLAFCIIISFSGFPIISAQLINRTWWCGLLFAEAALWIQTRGSRVGNRAGLNAGAPDLCASWTDGVLGVIPRWQERNEKGPDQKLR